MRALTLIYSHRVPGFKETQIEFDPIQKRNPNPKRQQKTCLSVDRTHATVDRSLPRSTGRSTMMIMCTSCTPVDRPSPPVDREHNLACSMRRFAPLSFDLCATFFHLLYFLSPYKVPRDLHW